MKGLGTVVHNEKIYNLNYMSLKEMEKLLKNIAEDKNMKIKEAKELLKK